MKNTRIIKTDWQTHSEQLASIRKTVFIEEQSVPVHEEWDGLDQNAEHYLIFSNDQPIGCARLIMKKDAVKVGRVAILKSFRGKGYATQLMKSIINDASSNQAEKIILDAQEYIIPMYKKLGFTVTSDSFMDAGIPHKSMQLIL